MLVSWQVSVALSSADVRQLLESTRLALRAFHRKETRVWRPSAFKPRSSGVHLDTYYCHSSYIQSFAQQVIIVNHSNWFQIESKENESSPNVTEPFCSECREHCAACNSVSVMSLGLIPSSRLSKPNWRLKRIFNGVPPFKSLLKSRTWLNWSPGNHPCVRSDWMFPLIISTANQ